MTGDRSAEQDAYYARTAAAYETAHVSDHDEHALALRYAAALMRLHGIQRVLDVGTGTGRAARALSEAGFDVVGLEPSAALLRTGVQAGLDGSRVVRGSGFELPFKDGAFDAVCEFGVLHHVKRPAGVVEEMLRVSRRAIFLSDTNRFGRAGLGTRLVKLALYRMGLWPLAYLAWTKGRGCDISDCDGVAYSYSVYDSLTQVEAWADRTALIPTKIEGARRVSWAHPLLTSSHVLLCGLRDRDG